MEFAHPEFRAATDGCIVAISPLEALAPHLIVEVVLTPAVPVSQATEETLFGVSAHVNGSYAGPGFVAVSGVTPDKVFAAAKDFYAILVGTLDDAPELCRPPYISGVLCGVFLTRDW